MLFFYHTAMTVPGESPAERKKMKVYIAGAITNDPDYKIKFDCAERLLRSEGHDVVNPAKNKPPRGKEWTYRDYINAGLKQLMTCDTIFMLKGGVWSGGAQLEWAYAKTVGMRLWVETDDGGDR